MVQAATKPPAYWVLAGLCIALLILQAIATMSVVAQRSGAGQLAIEAGQRKRLPISEAAMRSLDLTAENPLGTPSTNTTQPEAERGDTEKRISLADAMPQEAFNDMTAEEPYDAPASPHPAAAPAIAPDSTDSLVGDESEMRRTIRMEPRTAASLPAVSARLIEDTPYGALPKRDGDTSPFTYYRRPFTMPPAKRPVIAILITGLGPVKAQTEAALSLPPDIGFAFDPYAELTPNWLQSARNRGHEAWLILPAEPDNYPASDAGPLSLRREQNELEADKRLKELLGRVGGVVGLVLPVGETFSEDIPRLSWLNRQLEARGLALIAAEKPRDAGAKGWFKRETLTHLGDRVLDETLTKSAIATQLQALEKEAQQYGHALGVMRPYPISIEVLRAWLETLPQKPFLLAPPSMVVMK